MKKLTLNDFIKYSSPCFSCGKQSSIYVFAKVKDGDGKSHIQTIKPVFKKDFLDVDLRIKYGKILNLKINYKTNKFICSNLQDLTSYLKEIPLCVQSACNTCNSDVSSSNLGFNLNHGFMMPIELVSETIYLNYKDMIIRLNSIHDSKKSHLIVKKKTNSAPKTVLDLKIPLLTMFNLGNKEKLIQKVNTLLIMS